MLLTNLKKTTWKYFSSELSEILRKYVLLELHLDPYSYVNVPAYFVVDRSIYEHIHPSWYQKLYFYIRKWISILITKIHVLYQKIDFFI